MLINLQQVGKFLWVFRFPPTHRRKCSLMKKRKSPIQCPNTLIFLAVWTKSETSYFLIFCSKDQRKTFISAINKTDRTVITEILLKVELNTITLLSYPCWFNFYVLDLYRCFIRKSIICNSTNCILNTHKHDWFNQKSVILTLHSGFVNEATEVKCTII